MYAIADLKKRILVAREQRMIKENQLISQYGTTLIVFSLNLPGDMPVTQTVKGLHAYGMRQLMSSIKPYENRIEHVEVCEDGLGPIAYIGIDFSEMQTKMLAVELEERDMYGRLFDIDVIQSNGAHMSRTALNHRPRPCFLCDEDASLCRRKGAHSKEEINTYIEQLLEHFERVMNLRNQRLENIPSDDR